MQKQAPSLPRILVMAGFALSCFGLLLFLWLAFGGPIRHGLVLASCSTLQVLHQLSGPVPQLGTLGSLLNPPDQNAVCPTTSQAGAAPTQPGATVPATPAVPALPVRGVGRSR